MRYYTIVITPNVNLGQNFSPITYTSIGQLGDNYSCLQVDLDIYQAQFHQPAPLGSVTIYGVSFDDLNQSTNLVGANIQVYLGMTPGYSIVTPRQGLSISGSILQSFGNWQGANVSLTLIISQAQTVDPSNEVNLSLSWKKDQTLDVAVKETLKNAYNNIDVSGGFSQKLKYTEDQKGIFPNLKVFTKWVNDTSKQIIADPNYLGATIVGTSTGFNLSDGTQEITDVTFIDFTDLIGNITWLKQGTISVKVVMRTDLEVGSYITFPRSAPVVNTATFAQSRNQVAFSGIFIISQIRHQGFSRQADANSWVTVIEATLSNAPTYINFD